MHGIKWLFFDVGSTLMDESKVYDMRHAGIAEQAGVSFDEVRKRAIAYYREGKKGDKESAAYYGVATPKWDSSLEIKYPDADESLEKLSKQYKIGIIANQNLGTAKRLEEHGLMKYIDLVVASAEEGVEKPDPEIFKIALERSGCEASDACMIGDRMDNDIIPADKLGMKTVLIKRGFCALDESTYAVTPDLTVNDLNELTEIFLSQEDK